MHIVILSLLKLAILLKYAKKENKEMHEKGLEVTRSDEDSHDRLEDKKHL